MYIYKLGTECDGAQTQASDVYVPTLVALLGLCFDPSECFRDLCVWSGVMGNKSSKLWYVLQIVTGGGQTRITIENNIGNPLGKLTCRWTASASILSRQHPLGKWSHRQMAYSGID